MTISDKVLTAMREAGFKAACLEIDELNAKLRNVTAERDALLKKSAATAPAVDYNRPCVKPIVGHYVKLRNGMGPIGPVLSPVETGDDSVLAVRMLHGRFSWKRSGRAIQRPDGAHESFTHYDVVETCTQSGVCGKCFKGEIR